MIVVGEIFEGFGVTAVTRSSSTVRGIEPRTIRKDSNLFSRSSSSLSSAAERAGKMFLAYGETGDTLGLLGGGLGGFQRASKFLTERNTSIISML